jgi:hypothetical protein
MKPIWVPAANSAKAEIYTTEWMPTVADIIAALDITAITISAALLYLTGTSSGIRSGSGKDCPDSRQCNTKP